jgi:hypothetical protein
VRFALTFKVGKSRRPLTGLLSNHRPP